METIYCSTTHFIRHNSNLVDLNEFRRKLSLAQEGSLAPRLDQPLQAGQPQRPELKLLPQPQSRRSRRLNRTAWILDACASLGVVIMTVAFALSLFA